MMNYDMCLRSLCPPKLFGTATNGAGPGRNSSRLPKIHVRGMDQDDRKLYVAKMPEDWGMNLGDVLSKSRLLNHARAGHQRG